LPGVETIAGDLLLFRRHVAVWRPVQIVSRAAGGDRQEVRARSAVAFEESANCSLGEVRPGGKQQMMSAADKRDRLILENCGKLVSGAIKKRFD
jgi:hypothetical protein